MYKRQGIETQAGRALRDNDPLPVVSDLFQRLSLSILEMMQQLSEKYDVKNFIYMGGVSASSYPVSYTHLFIYILGAYLSKDYMENKKRPVYIIKEKK